MIGKVIYSIYSVTDWPTGYEPNGCYPGVVPVDQPIPLLVYDVSDIEPSPTKDSPVSALDTVTVNITVFAKTQLMANTIANTFRAKLDSYSTAQTINTVQMQSLRFQSQDEDYYDEFEAYVSRLTYKFRITR
jgi:hypothetical protein